MSFEEGFATGMKLGELWKARDEEEKMKQAWIKFHPEEAQKMGLVAKDEAPQGTVKSPGIAGQETNMPKDTVSLDGYKDGDVTTYPLKPEGEILDTSAPKGFATDPMTDVNPTSPYGTYEQSGAQSPADMPFGYGAIPKDYKPMEGNVDTTPTDAAPQESPQVTIEQGPKFSSMPQDVKDKLANAKTEDEYNGILNGYKNSQEQQPKQNLYDKTVAEIGEANTRLNTHQKELQAIKDTANEMRRQGLFKQAENYETKAVEAQKNVYESTKAFYEVASKGMDYQAQLAKSYQTAVANGANPDTAWKNLFMQAHTLGIPDLDKYYNLQGPARDQLLNQVIKNSVDIKTQMKDQVSQQRLQWNKEKFEKVQDRLIKNDIQKQQNTIWNQNFQQGKFDASMLNKDFQMTNESIKTAEAERAPLLKRLEQLTSGNMYFDELGNALTEPEDRQKEAVLLNKQIKAYDDQISVLRDHEADVRKALPTKEIKKAEKETSAVKISKSNIDLVIKAINTNPGAIDTIRKNFEEMHPGLKLEDYVKLNIPSKKVATK